MYETDVTVRVTTDVPIEPVGEYRRGKKGEHACSYEGYPNLAQLTSDATEPRLIVTPKEPAVSEPEFTIPVEVPKDVWEKYERGCFRLPRKGERFLGDTTKVHTAACSFLENRIVLTPRTPSYEYPPELMSPEVWGIAADNNWWWWVYSTEPKLGRTQFSSDDDCYMWDDIAWMFPNIQMPTPEQCNNDWRQSSVKNPKWKGE